MPTSFEIRKFSQKAKNFFILTLGSQVVERLMIIVICIHCGKKLKNVLLFICLWWEIAKNRKTSLIKHLLLSSRHQFLVIGSWCYYWNFSKYPGLTITRQWNEGQHWKPFSQDLCIHNDIVQQMMKGRLTLNLPLGVTM